MTALIGAVSPGLIVLVAGAVVAGVVQGISGFAFSMVAMSIWIWRVEPHEAVILAVFGGLCGQVLAALSIRRSASAPQLLPFLVGGLSGVPLGAWILPHMSGEAFRLILGAILVIGCPLMLFLHPAHRFRAGGAVADGAAGVAGGVIGGISGFTGIAPAIWCALRGYDKVLQRTLIQNFNLATLTATLAVFVWKGMVTTDLLPHMGLVAAALVIPSMIGARIYGRLSDASFRRVVLVLLTLSGVAIVASAA